VCDSFPSFKSTSRTTSFNCGEKLAHASFLSCTTTSISTSQKTSFCRGGKLVHVILPLTQEQVNIE
jgi:hypothetical protein